MLIDLGFFLKWVDLFQPPSHTLLHAFPDHKNLKQSGCFRAVRYWLVGAVAAVLSNETTDGAGVSAISLLFSYLVVKLCSI